MHKKMFLQKKKKRREETVPYVFIDQSLLVAQTSDDVLKHTAMIIVRQFQLIIRINPPR